MKTTEFGRLVFSSAIREKREVLRHSLGTLSTATGLSKPYLWELERGLNINPSVKCLMALSKELKIATSRLAALAAIQIQVREVDDVKSDD